jgi:NADH-ubiquinone oxidoreductase chain 5
MEGPTPVSALLHAATMVTAGIYLLLRFNWLLEYSSLSLYIILIIGIITNLLASLIGIVQEDIKKIIAYSTTSQLSYMFIGCGLSSYNISFFHLFNHAFFKALLFLTSGLIIHYFYHRQDIRIFSNLIFFNPLSYIMFFIGFLSLLGFPFLSGFYSKDLLIETCLILNNNLMYVIFYFLNLSIIFTAFYSIRVMCLLFFNSNLKVFFFIPGKIYFKANFLAGITTK